MKPKVETIVRWIFGDGYSQISNKYYYYAPDDPSYKDKQIDHKINLNHNPQGLLYRCFIFSHFEEAKKTEWFSNAMKNLNGYKTDTGRYIFPKELLAEQRDGYVIGGCHMNVGESKKNKNYAEILSTY